MGSLFSRQSRKSQENNAQHQRQQQEQQGRHEEEALNEMQEYLLRRYLAEHLERILTELERMGIEDSNEESNNLESRKQLQQIQQKQSPDTAEKCYDPSDPDLTFAESDKEDEHDFLCEGYSSKKALMSCGHSVTPTSLTYWCQIQLDQGNTTFGCGVCKAVWPFDEVCKMALLTDKERNVFEDNLFRNVDNKTLKTKQCPGCNSRVMRGDPHNLLVRCLQCTADNGKVYEFCWQCRKQWRGRGGIHSDSCGREGCENPDLIVLKTCPDIEFKDVEGVTGCPSVRACPTCGKLLGHNSEQCKNVTCPNCKMEFCFVCLKLTKECAGKTFSYYGACPSGVAPRQTSIPVMSKNKPGPMTAE